VQYEYVKNLWEKYRAKSTLFITWGFLKEVGVGQTPSGYLVMSPSQVKELHDVYKAEVGSHTMTHPYLTKVDDATLDYELSQSKENLEKLIGEEVTSFAYPYGDFDSRVIAYTKKYYRYARAAGKVAQSFYIPIRPWNKYIIDVVNTGNSPIAPASPLPIPEVWLFHQESLDTVESLVKTAIAYGAEFITFSEFVEAVRRLPLLGYRITYVIVRTNITSETGLPLGFGYHSIYDMYVISSSPDSVVRLWGITGVKSDPGGMHINATSYTTDVKLSDVYNYGHHLYEVDKWDTTNNIYRIRLKKPISGIYAVGLVPASGSAMSVKILLEIPI